MTSFSRRHPLLRRSLLALAGTALLAGIAGAPARADDDWRGRHERREHEWREHEWREHEARERWRAHEWAEWCAYHPGAYAYPGYVCPVPAPPAVVYAPAPPPPPAVIYQPPPSVEFVLPIHIR
jgi:hypothetical protein